jgi:hypothetical protein
VRDREAFRKRIGFRSDNIGQLQHLSVIIRVHVRLSRISLLPSRCFSITSLERRVQGQTEARGNVVSNIAIEVVVGAFYRKYRYCIGDT